MDIDRTSHTVVAAKPPATMATPRLRTISPIRLGIIATAAHNRAMVVDRPLVISNPPTGTSRATARLLLDSILRMGSKGGMELHHPITETITAALLLLGLGHIPAPAMEVSRRLTREDTRHTGDSSSSGVVDMDTPLTPDRM